MSLLLIALSPVLYLGHNGGSGQMAALLLYYSSIAKSRHYLRIFGPNALTRNELETLSVEILHFIQWVWIFWKFSTGILVQIFFIKELPGGGLSLDARVTPIEWSRCLLGFW